MKLHEVIASLSGWETKTASELVGLLNDPSIVVIDDELYTWAGVALTIGSAGADILRLALEGNGCTWAVYQLGGKGLQLSHPDTQALLSQFASAGVPGANTLALAGIHYVSPAQNAGLPPAILSEVEAAVAFLALQATKQAMEDDALNRVQSFRESISSWDGTGQAPVL
jgi:hypothetical protein